MAARSIGERLKEARKRRGLSQRELADASGVSLSLIRKLEQGERQDTRLETARRFASALRIPTSHLIPAEATDAEAAVGPEADRWAPVRAALAGPARDDVEELPTVVGVRTELDSAIALYSEGDLAGIGEALPRLIRDAHALAEHDPRGRALRMGVMQIAGRLMTQTRNYDAADTAFDRAERDAPDTLHGAALANNRVWLLLRRGRLADSRALAIQWADDTEPGRLSRATAGELSAWGWLLLRVAATASRDNRPDEAEHALRLATAAAVTLGRASTSATTKRAGFIRRYSRLTVAMQQAEHAMVEDRPDAVLRLADKIRADKLPPTTGNRNRHLLDVAHAQVLMRRHSDAVGTFLTIEEDAPQWLPHQRYAREVLGLVVRRRRTLTPEMRRLANLVRLPL
ncbi:helix-turn-helix domain-containing protein [Streptomyces litchfieldiae]|uniref:Helix-turn-helix transcriptional regulator n=1 Tax=Streptomyces litchfieldiae TaxID=3075543 RepID=A0ABU2MJG8_9ACTN|nr:helix-turn-helix transcriptional regulator [Streptomyces sp. DSM 44938]MDT0341577.1 helix-turn-helix transcriptional regulator [Streptomyces sp. DSM 44938]